MTLESARQPRGNLSPNTSVDNARDNMYVAALVVMVAVAIAAGLYVGMNFGKLAQANPTRPETLVALSHCPRSATECIAMCCSQLEGTCQEPGSNPTFGDASLVPS